MGGQERVALDLASRQVRAGLRVSALSLAPPPDGPLEEAFRAAGVGVSRVARHRPGVAPSLLMRLCLWFRRNAVDLVHTHNRMPLIYAAPAARLAGAAVVHTKHGSNPKGGRRLAAGNVAGRFVDAFVAVSAGTAAVARARREIDPSRLSVIENGIDLERYLPDAAARWRVRAELGLDEDAWLVGTVGRLAVEKNQALLLRAAAPLLGPRAHVVVAGTGPLLAELQRAADELGVAPFVHLLGVRNDVSDVLNALDVFALTSDTEGLPLVVPEAMAVGLPVVATAVGGVPTVIAEGRTGFLVPPRDEQALRERLALLRDDRVLARDCGGRGRLSSLERFSLERMAAEYLDLYRPLLARRGTPLRGAQDGKTVAGGAVRRG
jgi:glycosyltransferase involved in cell wall biosynthesis